MLVRTTAKRIAGAIAAAGLSLSILASAGPAYAAAGFERWIASFRAPATQRGVSVPRSPWTE